MKRAASAIILLCTLFSCASSRYYKMADEEFKNGNYPLAAAHALSSLEAKAENQDAMLLLEKAYPLAVEMLSSRITELNAGNDEFKWSKTADIYAEIHNLSQRYDNLPALYHKKQDRRITVDSVYFNEEHSAAKKLAAEEHYRAGNALSNTRSKEELRTAIEHFEAALFYVPGYKNSAEMIDLLMESASDIVLILPRAEKIPFFSNRRFEEIVYDDLTAALFQGSRKKKYMKIIDRSNIDLILEQQQFALTGLTNNDTLMEIGELSNADTLVTYSISAIDYTPGTANEFSEFREKDLSTNEKDEETGFISTKPAVVSGTIYTLIKTSSMVIRASYRIISMESSQIIDSESVTAEVNDTAQWLEFEGDTEVLEDYEKRQIENPDKQVMDYADLLYKAEEELVKELAGKILKNFN